MDGGTHGAFTATLPVPVCHHRPVLHYSTAELHDQGSFLGRALARRPVRPTRLVGLAADGDGKARTVWRSCCQRPLLPFLSLTAVEQQHPSTSAPPAAARRHRGSGVVRGRGGQQGRLAAGSESAGRRIELLNYCPDGGDRPTGHAAGTPKSKATNSEARRQPGVGSVQSKSNARARSRIPFSMEGSRLLVALRCAFLLVFFFMLCNNAECMRVKQTTTRFTVK